MKRITFILLCLITTIAIFAQDKKITIKSITASSYQSGEGAKNAIDGNMGTIWHSSWGGTTFPVTVTMTLNEVSRIDYIRYTPRQDGSENGHWDEVTLSYNPETTGSTFTEIGSYELGGTSAPYNFTMPDGGIVAGKLRFVIKSGRNGYTSAAEIEAFAYDKTKQLSFEKYADLFDDPLYTTLKEGVTTSDGIEDADVKKLIDNLLSDADGYPKFRIGEYEAYLTTETLKRRLKTSSLYNNYENPTGVYLKKGDSCIVMVSGIDEKYPVNLKMKNWVRDEYSSSYPLQNGFNYIIASTEGNVFVDYYNDEFDKAPDVKVHFVNAPVLGYWDQETMTNDDWKAMLKGRERNDSTIIITRSEHAQTAYPICSWLRFNPDNIDSVMTLYQNVQWAERNMMGLEKYGRQTKNRQLFYAVKNGIMAAGGEGGFLGPIDDLGALMYPDAERFGWWGVAHEWGHNNQIDGFKWSGCGETTNNIYASWVYLLFQEPKTDIGPEGERTGINDFSDLRGGRIECYFEEGLRLGKQWQLQEGPDYFGSTPENIRIQGQDADGKSIGYVNTTKRNYDHFVKVIPFYQLNIWGTLAGKCPDIIPMVIEAIRNDADYNTKYNTNGKQQVNWMKLACDSAKINLLPFFERAGMLRPINKYIEDYGAGWNIITEEMIDELKAHVKEMGYPTPDEEMNYICAFNMHIYRDKLKLEVPAELNAGCTYKNGKVTVDHNVVKNAVAFETYNAAGELLRITKYALGCNDTHTNTQVLYPGGADETDASAYIMAVGYDSTRVKIYEKTNIVKTLGANRYYRLTLPSRGGTALSCGANTSAAANGTITWNLARSAKSNSKADQIWMWEKRDDGNTYLYNPQSGHYFGGSGSSQTTQLYTESTAPAWEASCVDEKLNKFTFNIKGSGDYMNGYSNTDTGMWGGGAGDPNNVWTIEEVTTLAITISANRHNAVCYPFALETPEKLTAYIVSGHGKYNYEGTDYDYALLEEFESRIVPANMPVIYSGESGSYTMNIITEDNTEASTANILQGTTLKKTLGAGTFLSTMATSTVAGTTAVIKSSTTGTQVSANKGYLIKSDVGDASQLYLGVKSVVTGIDGIEAEESGAKFYNLDGTTATELESGKIYITSDGKKIIVK